MATIGWLSGRTITLTIPNGGTATDILDLGAVSSYQASGIASGVPTTTNIPTLKIGDAPAYTTDQFKDKFIVFKPNTTTANLRDQIRLITASTSAGVLTVSALTDAPVAGDTFDIVNAPAAGSKAYRRLDISIHTPATVTGTVNVQLSPTETGTFGTLQSGGADIVLPTGSKVTPLIPLVGRYMRLFGGAQGQITRFIVVGVSNID
jgi:hypothetical protein